MRFISIRDKQHIQQRGLAAGLKRIHFVYAQRGPVMVRPQIDIFVFIGVQGAIRINGDKVLFNSLLT